MAVEVQALASVLAAALAECPEAVVRAQAVMAPAVAEEQDQDQLAKVALFGKAVEVQEPLEAV